MPQASARHIKMLEEAQDLKVQGSMWSLGYFEPHGAQDTIAKTEGLEIVPSEEILISGHPISRRWIPTQSWRRHPEYASSTSFHIPMFPVRSVQKRWEDVECSVDAGHRCPDDDEHPASGEPERSVSQITGIRIRETIPDWVLKQADEVVMIDLTPRALLNRLERGVVYGREKAQKAMQNFFRESSLVALRELTLREAAHEVKDRIEDDNSRTPT